MFTEKPSSFFAVGQSSSDFNPARDGIRTVQINPLFQLLKHPTTFPLRPTIAGRTMAHMEEFSQIAPHQLLAHHLKYLEEKKNLPLRTIARRLNISPATLSQVLSGKRPVTFRTAIKLAEGLALSAVEKQELLQSVLCVKEYQLDPQGDPAQYGDEFLKIQADSECALSNWYYFAILSLGDIQPNYSNPQWIARTLGISVRQANQAFCYLEQNKLVKRRGRGFSQMGKPLYLFSQRSSHSLRERYFQLLEKAENSLKVDSVSERDFSSITMAIDERKLEYARKMAQDFRRKLCRYLESGERNRVYTLCVQLFPLSAPIKGRKNV